MTGIEASISGESPPLVVDIDESLTWGRDLLGGKAWSLVRLIRSRAAVPAAVTLTTRAFAALRHNPELLVALVDDAIARLERRTGRVLGGPDGDLLVSVRSGAPVSMPGMMDTVLNLGSATTRATDEPISAFRLDVRQRFLWQFAESVLQLGSETLQEVRDEVPPLPQQARADRLAHLEDALRERARDAGRPWPVGDRAELYDAVRAVLSSWDSGRAQLYRRMRGIDDSLGTAVTIQVMVFGNRDDRSGAGVAFSRDPNNGEAGLVGEYLAGAQGEEVVSGRATPERIDALRATHPSVYEALMEVAQRLERESGAVQEIEFTVESGNLFILQTREARLTSAAAARVATEFVEQGLLGRDQALEYAFRHGFDPGPPPMLCAVRADAVPLARGMPVGGGVKVGRVVLSELDAKHYGARQPLVFVADETSPHHLPLMRQASAVVTMRGGATSHAAVVARELKTACVVGVGSHIVGRRIVLNEPIEVGDVLTVDGDTGVVYRGDVTEVRLDQPPAEQLLRSWARRESAS
jgi:pyruvate,orthophosphate dikinase